MADSDEAGREITGRMRFRSEGQFDTDQTEPGAFTALTGETLGENEQHRLVREALLERLFADEQVEALFKDWDERSGLSADLKRLYENHSAQVALWGPTEWARRAARGQGAAPDAADPDNAAGAIAGIVLADPATAALCVEAVDFTARFECDLPWLAMELVIELLRRCTGSAPVRPDPVRGSRRTEAVDLAAPPLEIPAFTTGPWEGTAAALSRLEQMQAAVDRAREELLAVAPKRGRIPGGATKETLERYAHWYYLVKFKGQTPYQVARDYFGKDDVRGGWNTVKYGIDRAEYLLSLTLPYPSSGPPP